MPMKEIVVFPSTTLDDSAELENTPDFFHFQLVEWNFFFWNFYLPAHCQISTLIVLTMPIVTHHYIYYLNIHSHAP